VDVTSQAPRNHATPIVSDDMERLRTNGVGDSKNIVHETVRTIVSHVERSCAAGIATLVESDGPISGRAKSFQVISPPTGELRPAVQQHDDRTVLGTGQPRVDNQIAHRKLGPSQAHQSFLSLGSGPFQAFVARGWTKSALR
jgi:hypothetical protein